MTAFPARTKAIGKDSFFYTEKVNFVEIKKGYLFEMPDDGINTVLDFLVPGDITLVAESRSLFSLYTSEIAIAFPSDSEQLLLYEQRKARSDKLLTLADTRNTSLSRVAGTIHWMIEKNLDNISHSAVAMISNLTRETVSRKIAYLKKKNIVVVAVRGGNMTGRILVTNELKLKAIAQNN